MEQFKESAVKQQNQQEQQKALNELILLRTSIDEFITELTHRRDEIDRILRRFPEMTPIVNGTLADAQKMKGKRPVSIVVSGQE